MYVAVQLELCVKCHSTATAGADPFGFPTLVRPWDDGSDSLENAKRRLRAAFEFFTKLGVSFLGASSPGFCYSVNSLLFVL